MGIYIVIGACVLGAIIGLLCSGGKDMAGNAAGGAVTGGCVALGCILRLAFTALIIIAILWLFGLLFN